LRSRSTYRSNHQNSDKNRIHKAMSITQHLHYYVVPLIVGNFSNAGSILLDLSFSLQWL
jgi:hypothetical protein